MAVGAGGADPDRLILFSSVYLFLPPPLRFNPVSWEIPVEIYSLLKYFFSLALRMPSPVRLCGLFLAGEEKRRGTGGELCSGLPVCVDVRALLVFPLLCQTEVKSR